MSTAVIRAGHPPCRCQLALYGSQPGQRHDVLARQTGPAVPLGVDGHTGPRFNIERLEAHRRLCSLLLSKQHTVRRTSLPQPQQELPALIHVQRAVADELQPRRRRVPLFPTPVLRVNAHTHTHADIMRHTIARRNNMRHICQKHTRSATHTLRYASVCWYRFAMTTSVLPSASNDVTPAVGFMGRRTMGAGQDRVRVGLSGGRISI